MIKAIILDGYSPKEVVVKFGKNYECVSFAYFLNSLCRSHISDYEVKTVHLKDIEIENKAVVRWFETLSDMSFHATAIQSCEEFENLWKSDEVVDGIDLY